MWDRAENGPPRESWWRDVNKNNFLSQLLVSVLILIFFLLFFGLFCSLTFQIQETNRKFIEKGYEEKPIYSEKTHAFMGTVWQKDKEMTGEHK